MGPEALDEEDPDDDPHREGDDELMEGGGGHLEPLHRAEHRHRRGDDPIAVEEGRPEQAEGDQHHPLPRGQLVPPEEEGEHGEDPALALVVRPEDEEDVLDANYEDQ